ncbi:PREDICTED: uncharacterized protein LOC109214383 [Nicotiana attenuata]|uniref:uncharacterized protein LOC109214383 n=1 Tax=Nicotiana attenuata TaxID=49451 RepID=UPI000905C39B|nr:PREDICTED: uncharacterized protein LOC109214383 [Nicotiana attenuata]
MFDSSQLIQLRDQEDVNTLLQFNDGFAHVYASSLEKEPCSRLPLGGVKKVEIIDSEPDTSLAGDDVNDLACLLKKVRFRSAGDTKPQKKEVVGGDGPKHVGVTSSCSNSMNKLNQNGVCLPEGDVQNNNSKIGTVNKQASRPQSGLAEKVELIVDSESYAIPDSDPLDVFNCPDSEFNDFDKHKVENCFVAGQIWTCYDMDDGMPRLYALIRKVSSPEFKIKFSWFKPPPEDERQSAWIRADLPVGCGKFRHGNSEYTFTRLIFSHQVPCEKSERGMLIVYPRKGETWALFKDWDISWSADPDDHSVGHMPMNYTYEVVEILSGYVGDAGVKVGYLDKVNGFVSLFQRTKITVAGTFFVKPNELYKFSHRIPSFNMTGTEREDVPGGSFELDLLLYPSIQMIFGTLGKLWKEAELQILISTCRRSLVYYSLWN